MRRPLYVLSALAVGVLALAGCSAASDDAATASPSASAAADLCASAAPSGSAAEAVSVTGAFDEQPTVSFSLPLEVNNIERTVVSEGSGTPIAAGDYVTYALAAFDAATGELQGATGYGGTGVQTQPVGAGSLLGQIFGCATPGTRVAVTLPAASTGAAQVFVVDLLSATPADQWCAVEPFEGQAPTVAFTDGNPTITIPAAEPESGVRVEVLSEGDGETVGAGDTVEVNYEGVKWSDGTTFDSSYDRGESASFPTDGVVVGFKRALEGQKVGSQVLVSMSPSCGYGDTASANSPLGGETLVFVVDIIATAPTEG